jgi:hypothetical protein
MLVRVQNVGVVLKQEIGDGRDQAFLVGAADEEDGAVLH